MLTANAYMLGTAAPGVQNPSDRRPQLGSVYFDRNMDPGDMTAWLWRTASVHRAERTPLFVNTANANLTFIEE